MDYLGKPKPEGWIFEGYNKCGDCGVINRRANLDRKKLFDEDGVMVVDTYACKDKDFCARAKKEINGRG